MDAAVAPNWTAHEVPFLRTASRAILSPLVGVQSDDDFGCTKSLTVNHNSGYMSSCLPPTQVMPEIYSS
jgi:hypothetical protein